MLALEQNDPYGWVALSKSMNLSLFICELGLMTPHKIKVGNVHNVPNA